MRPVPPETRPGNNRPARRVRAAAVAGFCLGLGAATAPAQEKTPSLEEVWQIIQQQQAEIDSLKRENAELRQQLAPRPAAQPAASAPAVVASAPPVAVTTAAPELAPEPEASTKIDLYGFAMLDMGYQSQQNDPDWYDVLRPTKLPAFEDQYGDDGEWFASVRQSRFGVQSLTPTALGDLKTIFEFELFGTGDDAGQTTFRLRHAWGELGQFGAGQYWSAFMDIDVFPNSIEYWGPNGMVFYRNVQARWTPWSDGDSRFAITLERPGGSGDAGEFEDRVQLEEVKGDFELPDLAAHYRIADDWGHVQIAGILRDIQWVDSVDNDIDLGGSDTGWGLNLSTNYRIGPHIFRGSVVYGEGIQNYMNDATADIGVEDNFGNPRRPISGEAIPMLGLVAFLDLNWSDKWTSTIGYSMLDNDLPEGQLPSTFEKGQYALTNLLYHPTPEVFYGVELQWGERENFTDGFSSDDFRVQFSAKYNFSQSFGGN